MTARKRAMIVGATGVVGRNLVGHLARLPDWEVVAVSRRKPDAEGNYLHLPVDLLNREETLERLGRPLGITHLFYSAYVDRPSWSELVEPNVAMLVNAMDAVEPASPELRHVNVMHGTKWYGSHLGPFKTPAKEDDPRHMPPNFYFDQQDFIAARQVGKRWTWSTARPHAICGFATGNPMNLVMLIAVYAAISKALGLPLRFPGTAESYRSLYQCTDMGLLGNAMVWMSTDPRCANEPFNVTNGDVFRWENVWPKFAAHLGMEAGPRQQVCLSEMMKDKGPVWDRLVAEHGLKPLSYQEVAAWGFGDFVFSSGWDIISSMGKARRYGFQESVESEDMFLRLFDQLRTNRVIP